MTGWREQGECAGAERRERRDQIRRMTGSPLETGLDKAATRGTSQRAVGPLLSRAPTSPNGSCPPARKGSETGPHLPRHCDHRGLGPCPDPLPLHFTLFHGLSPSSSLCIPYERAMNTRREKAESSKIWILPQKFPNETLKPKHLGTTPPTLSPFSAGTSLGPGETTDPWRHNPLECSSLIKFSSHKSGRAAPGNVSGWAWKGHRHLQGQEPS